MTTLEFMEKQLRKCKTDLEQQELRQAPKSNLENLKEKISHYEIVCEMLKGYHKQSEGEWVKINTPFGQSIRYKCSLCDAVISVSETHFKYCPICGTKIKGGAE